jgi:hypothetical protein
MRVQADEYIERTGVSAMMKDAVLLLLENRSRTSAAAQSACIAHLPLSLSLTQRRPADPILFLAQYFEQLEAEQSAMQVRAVAAAAAAHVLARAAADADAQRTLHYINLAAPQRPCHMCSSPRARARVPACLCARMSVDAGAWVSTWAQP